MYSKAGEDYTVAFVVVLYHFWLSFKIDCFPENWFVHCVDVINGMIDARNLNNSTRRKTTS